MSGEHNLYVATCQQCQNYEKPLMFCFSSFFPSKCGCFEAKTGHSVRQALLLFRNYRFFLFLSGWPIAYCQNMITLLKLTKPLLKVRWSGVAWPKVCRKRTVSHFTQPHSFSFFFISILASSLARPFACVGPRRVGRMLAACFVNRDILSRKREQRTSTHTRPRSCVHDKRWWTSENSRRYPWSDTCILNRTA